MRARFLWALSVAATLAVVTSGRAVADEAAPAAAAVAAPAPMPAMNDVVVAVPQQSSCCSCFTPWCRRLRIDGHVAMVDGPEGPPGGVSSGLADAIDWDSLDYGLAFGGSASFEWKHGCCGSTRVRGTYWGTWDDSDTVTGTLGATPFPGGPVQVSPVFAVDLSSEATLWDADVMFWRPVCRTPCSLVEIGIGARFVSFSEDSTFTFPQGAATATMDAEADNLLLAVQIGARAERCVTRCLSVFGEADAFVGWRHTEREVAAIGLLGPAPIVGGSATDDGVGFGFSGELGLRWHVSRCWSVVGGYGFMLLFDQARGFELADFSNTLSLDLGPTGETSTLFAHRLFLGVELSF
jgi:hypothetical protein